ncbi:MAG TPA: DUF2628 domain-containing protein, partial [Tianweitania sediminis]|nr:DUF2628 domain-containing protein [Tianweitania sediminis]
MAIYVVMQPVDAGDAAEKAVLVRDGVHGLAFILPVVWLLLHRLWIEAAAAFALMLAAGALMSQVGGHPLLGSAMSLLIALYFGLEAPALWLNSLRRRGYVFW